ncbi:glycosyltransferase [Gordonia amicalis]|uniref:Glycosyltransferase n=1 Tax=Gordonia amicalis TaxID=89053 RepID=A0AAE4R6R6_9ACTN|nr:glycosyltransferase [Gordonia amicalis]MDV6314525.1 glycosyltransferase [Gordonia amicalis]UPW13457.1 glycosyltransferase [Gordonia amicalis]
MTVLLSLKRPDGTTRFVDQIVSERPDSMHVLYFSWREALRGKYDVFHVHWPEWLVRHSNPIVRAGKYFLMTVFLIRLKVRRTPVIRTIHNQTPHRPGTRAEALLVSALDHLTDNYIALNPFADTTSNVTLIRHGHYKDQFGRHRFSEVEPNSILFFGRIEPYKNVDKLIEKFAEMQSESATLRLVGAIEEHAFPDKAASLRAAAASHRRISTKFQFLSDADLVAEVTRAQLVVLPYTEMYNSGALLVALSLGRPVLAPRTEVNEWIQSEVGSRWLNLYKELTSDTLHAALRSAGDRSASAYPDLANRDWKAVSQQHYLTYQRVRNQSPRPKRSVKKGA